jgi:HAMP domain-containing protein
VLLNERTPSPEHAAQVATTAKLFDTSLKALQHGGSVPLKLDGTVPKLIDGAASKAEIIAQLEAVESVWMDHRDALKTLSSPKFDLSAERATILATNVKLLADMNAAVGRAQQVSEAQLALMRTVNAVAVTIGLVLALLSVFVALGIGGSLRKLQKVADEISTGDLDSPVPTGRFGEIRDLSASLERMRTSLGQAMQMLAEQDDDDPLLAV